MEWDTINVKGGQVGLRKIFPPIFFYHEKFTLRIYIGKTPGLISGGGGGRNPLSSQNIIGLKNSCMILYMC